ncbi:GHKL domain-containing protein [Chitinophaga ginsengisoli]|uniref:GHKL domain-containing protein n=2 Tax=Chitinophaga ginsengisoli TaxID=363837 RepID=A0A2P8GAN7_9BACT|nr:GHKL domain-containing protein [Chitinophaga ginsengisoli]
MHLFFLLTLFFLLVVILLISRTLSYIATGLFCYAFTLCAIYAGRWICKKWLASNKWSHLIFAVVNALVGFTLVGTAGFVYLFNPGMPINHILESAINISVLSFFLLFSGFFITITRSALREKMNGLVLAEQKKESELNLLRSQVSPHFLFNTLHNMYSLSVNRPAQLPPLLLQLSELLRYSVYEADQPLVTLQEEMAYIRNYIALENIRLADRLKLTVNMDDNPDDIKIVPMLLIVFVENAFKHARNTSEQQIYINIHLKVRGNTIYFMAENSCSNHSNEDGAGKRNSGLGIANVIKRLELLYPDAYGLKQNRTNNLFKVELWLKEK